MTWERFMVQRSYTIHYSMHQGTVTGRQDSSEYKIHKNLARTFVESDKWTYSDIREGLVYTQRAPPLAVPLFVDR